MAVLDGNTVGGLDKSISMMVRADSGHYLSQPCRKIQLAIPRWKFGCPRRGYVGW